MMTQNKYIKAKIRTCAEIFYTTFCGLNMPEDDIECESFTVISIDYLLVYDEKYYLQIYLENFLYKIMNKQITDYLDENLFEDQILYMLYYDIIDISKRIDLAKSNDSK